MERLRPTIDMVICSKQTINTLSKEIHQRCEKVENDVEEFFNEYFAALERHKCALLEEINHVRCGKMERVLAVQAELDKRTKETDQVIAYTEELLRAGNDIETLTLVRLLRKRFECCQKLATTSTNFKVH